MEVREYRDGDIDRIEHRECGIEATLEWAVTQSVAFTLESDGTPIGMFGFVSSAPHIWDCWASFSDRVRRHGKALTRIIRGAIRNRTQGPEVKRVQVLVDARHPEYMRWAKLLGFREEALMKYVMQDGGDAYLMAYLPKEHRNGR